MQQREADHRRILVLALGVVGVGIVALLLWVWNRPDKNPLMPKDQSREAAGEWKTASVRPATLFECYEHARENVPPRNDTGTRQRSWQAPPMPLETIRAAVNEKSAAGDRELLKWVENW